MKTVITRRLAGTKNEFWILKVWRDIKKPVIVHTNKRLSEIKRLEKEYLTGVR